MKNHLHGTRFLLAETAHDRLPESQAEVAFVGRSNVGKSSLICALTNNWKLARVSKTPGATRGINVYEVRPGRWLVDLPGYGYAVGSERERNYWPEMIGRYLSERPLMKRAYVLIDAEVGAGPIDISLIDWLVKQNIPYHIVATKSDKLGRQRHAAQRDRIAAAVGNVTDSVFWVTAKDGYGIDMLQKDVTSELGLLTNV